MENIDYVNICISIDSWIIKWFLEIWLGKRYLYRYIKKIYLYILFKSVIYFSIKFNGFENKNCMGVENFCGMI